MTTPTYQIDQASLFAPDRDVKVRNTTVGPVSVEDVNRLCRAYHYSRTAGSAMYRWGLWHGADLLGAVAYNLPTRDVCASVFGEEQVARVWHMGRLVLHDWAPRNSESRLIAGSLREIERVRPDIWAVVTYAAIDAGHLGYVYQATNAIYTGIGGDTTYFTDQKGRRRSTYLSQQHVSESRARSMGWTKHKGAGKHRYVYVLGNRAERRQRRELLRFKQLPYPKA